MAFKEFMGRIRNKLDTNANLANMIPLQGEMVLGKTVLGIQAKFGDGTSKFSALPYSTTPQSYVDAKIHIGPSAPTNSNCVLWIDTST